MGFLIGIILGIATCWFYMMLYVKGRIRVLSNEREIALAEEKITEANKHDAVLKELQNFKFGLSEK
ncbi:hypothetical protein JJB07_02965 [Tumebacillus sp. ITR2]|uniref:Uncharacterized protein n=1 Tax=Tumebacillus amylolyticus TaxID=2801339 RepID=A0ABS1J5R6_9BACL|nr:hypothetical protein [Tumebacillus amylolyticus]MBL0385601.1 hypothetical protein [Tumebacillus amylolyticus]